MTPLRSLLAALFLLAILPAAATPPVPQLEGAVNTHLDRLAQAALNLAYEALIDEGSVYPFALVADRDGQVSARGYRGDPQQAPPAEVWVGALFRALQEDLATDPQLTTAALVRLTETLDPDSGRQVPALWVLADQRDQRAVVILVPFVKNPDTGKDQPGRMMYYGPEQTLFPH